MCTGGIFLHKKLFNHSILPELVSCTWLAYYQQIPLKPKQNTLTITHYVLQYN